MSQSQVVLFSIVKCDWGLRKGTRSSKKPNGGEGTCPPLSGYATVYRTVAECSDLIDNMAMGKFSTWCHTSISVEIPTLFLPYFKFQVE